MPLTKQRLDRLFGQRQGFRGFRLDHDHAHRTEERRTEHLALGRGQRNDHRIVLIPAVQVLPLAAEHADHDERILLDADGLADRIVIDKEVFSHGLADQRDAGCGTHIGIRQKLRR